jgi:uncharacterized membrane protein
MNKTTELSSGERFADALAAFVGSWPFLIIQSLLVALWIVYNLLVASRVWQFDPYPFVFLNLIFSLQGAYTAPIIMISQNRQDRLDRRRAEHTNEMIKKLMMQNEELHAKIDGLGK